MVEERLHHARQLRTRPAGRAESVDVELAVLGHELHEVQAREVAGVDGVLHKTVHASVAIEAGAELGLDLSAHRSTPVEDVDLTTFDLVIVMEQRLYIATLKEF